jgi:FtsP/CotA-like multicopper oxidase with cupredoxin domain
MRAIFNQSLAITCAFFVLDPLAYSQQTSKKETIFVINQEKININNKPTTVFKITQSNGVWGYRGVKGEIFDAIVKNKSNVPATVHWHGLILPNNMDGVPLVTQAPIPPGGEFHYKFKLVQSGTYWMHSHQDFQIQQLLSAPLIIEEPQQKNHEKEVVLFLADFTYQSPESIFQNLKKPQEQMHHMHKMDMSKPDLNDVKYDAFLTNYKTLKNPEIVTFKPGETIRLRVIAGSAMSNFFINTGKLQGEAIAVDGNDIEPFADNLFQLAVGQRIDIRVRIPKEEGYYPILAQGEGTNMQTGLILATPNAKIQLPPERVNQNFGALNYQQEYKTHAIQKTSLPKPDQKVLITMQGDMSKYIWTLNNEKWPNINPVKIENNKNVEITFKNDTEMAHPMHFHGHVFKVTEIDGKELNNGPYRDTVLVLPKSTVKVQFVSNNLGNWVLHCHMVYHMAGGMITLLNYENTALPKWMNFSSTSN